MTKVQAEEVGDDKRVFKDYVQRAPVQWFSPTTAIQTLVRVVRSEVQIDYREIQACQGDQPSFSYTGDEQTGEMWVDYLADTGDGWNATFSVFSSLWKKAITVTHEGQTYHTKRGSVLLMGGDEVYPFGSNTHYMERLVGPMEAAAPRDTGWSRLKNRLQNRQHKKGALSRADWDKYGDSFDERLRCLADGMGGPNANGSPDTFAVAGNHDWYDGLVSFCRLFCEQRMLGGWNTRQTRSYFVVSLSHGWWVVGVDIRLNQVGERRETPAIHSRRHTSGRRAANH
jgi:hypothetical protein